MTEQPKADVLDFVAWVRAHPNRIAHDRSCARDEVLQRLVAMELMRHLDLREDSP